MIESAYMTSTAEREFRRLSRENQERVRDAVRRFVEEGRGDVKKLVATNPAEWRLKATKDIRVIYILEDDGRVMTIRHVLPRDKVYEVREADPEWTESTDPASFEELIVR